ncbi:hypothetical protein EIP86_010226 [Pleurotus ostreatoroseus]|nr:hypothetical protein EIP86_010226 [Pleurotus ostreatoroseus]
MSSSVNSRLFTAVKVGSVNLAHRIVLAPLTRFRANSAHVHEDLAIEYYAQRASVPGTLLITEATLISRYAGNYPNVPGIWNEDQIKAWKKIVDAVHAKGSYIFVQLWALGRTANHDDLKAEELNLTYVAPSAIQLTDRPFPPRALTVNEIKEYQRSYVAAAENAIRAGFDGVELHSANGYLPDQFLQDVSNKRVDEYGGSIENRARFSLEILEGIVNAIGAEKTGIRLSPWSEFNDMRMENPKPTFTYLVNKISEKHPNLAYLHLVEPRAEGNTDRVVRPGESNDFLRDIWAPRPFISAGGFTRELALEHADKTGDLVAFGRSYISNPDLPLRVREDIPFTPSDRNTYYTPESPVGYIDYPFADSAAD